MLWWRWLQSVVAKAESAAEEGAAKDGRIAATALLAALDAVDSVLDTEEGSYRVTANADCAMVEPLRLPVRSSAKCKVAKENTTGVSWSVLNENK